MDKKSNKKPMNNKQRKLLLILFGILGFSIVAVIIGVIILNLVNVIAGIVMIVVGVSPTVAIVVVAWFKVQSEPDDPHK
ncbi:MAG: hypothetical protein FWH03_02935 [Firmicutes bacterium]|nr:hypothetical protein [Bacillota bacterium]